MNEEDNAMSYFMFILDKDTTQGVPWDISNGYLKQRFEDDSILRKINKVNQEIVNKKQNRIIISFTKDIIKSQYYNVSITLVDIDLFIKSIDSTLEINATLSLCNNNTKIIFYFIADYLQLRKRLSNKKNQRIKS